MHAVTSFFAYICFWNFEPEEHFLAPGIALIGTKTFHRHKSYTVCDEVSPQLDPPPLLIFIAVSVQSFDRTSVWVWVLKTIAGMRVRVQGWRGNCTLNLFPESWP